MRREVRELAAWAPLRPEDTWDARELDAFDVAVEAVAPPLTGEEALALLPLLDRSSEDSVHGVVWGVLHLVESSGYSDWQPEESPGKPWLDLLHRRWVNGGSPR